MKRFDAALMRNPSKHILVGHVIERRPRVVVARSRVWGYVLWVYAAREGI